MATVNKFVCYGDIEPKKVKWLYYPYIPKGKITIICGDPGIGKTTFVLSLVALLSSGKKLPFSEQSHDAMNVYFQSAEDGTSDTIIPRLLKMGADCTKVVGLQTKRKFESFDADLEHDIINQNIKLMVFDPVQAFMGSLNICSANDVREVMQKLNDFADRTDCAIVLIGHLNKNSGGINALYRSLGSIDIVAAARSVLILTTNPNNPDNRIMVPLKSNLAKIGKSIIYDLENGAVKWIGLSDVKAADLSGSDPAPAFKNACDFLSVCLEHGDVASTKIFELAAKNGICISTLKKAKAYLGIKSVKKNDDRWYYQQIKSSDETATS